jgi:hypothetical protein
MEEQGVAPWLESACSKGAQPFAAVAGASMAAGRAEVSAMGTAGSHEAERGRWEVKLQGVAPWEVLRCAGEEGRPAGWVPSAMARKSRAPCASVLLL